MELDFIHVVDVFKYLTSFLIAWGVFGCISMARILKGTKSTSRALRLAECQFGAVIFIVTTLLALALFVFPAFTAQYMFTILSMEVWYTFFAIYCTSQYMSPCMTRICHQEKLA